MWEKIRVIWQIPELRTKILLTLLMLAIYRVGFQIQLPIIDQAAVETLRQPERRHRRHAGNGRRAQRQPADRTSRSSAWGSCRTSRRRSSSSSWPASIRRSSSCRRKAKPAARRSTNTRATPRSFLCLFQSWFYVESYVEPQGLGGLGVCRMHRAQLVWHWKIVAVLTMTAGTMFLMWLGEQIDEFGIGNGISLLIMAGILARMPAAGYRAAAAGLARTERRRHASWASKT